MIMKLNVSTDCPVSHLILQFRSKKLNCYEKCENDSIVS